MRLENYRPAKQNVVLEEVKVASSGSIELFQETSVGYFKVVAVGPLCETAKVGDYVIIKTQPVTELEFVDKVRAQLPEFGIDGYYTPSNEELENPVPIFEAENKEEEEMNVIDSEGGDNSLGTEFGDREN